MLPARSDPFSMKAKKVADIEGVENAFSLCREGELFLIGLSNQAGIRGSDHFDSARPKSRDQIGIHGVLVEVDADLIQEESAPVLLLKGFCFPGVGFQVGVDFALVGVIIGEGCMNLSQRQVAELSGDLFRDQAHLVPQSDSTDRYPGSRNASPPAADLGSTGDEAADLGYGRHRLQYTGSICCVEPFITPAKNVYASLLSPIR